MVMPADLVILGGGCAGLALAREIALRAGSLRTVIIEPRRHYEEDRTWSFWARVNQPMKMASRGQWSGWEITSATRSCRHQSDDWSYHWISSADYYEDALTTIRRSNQTELRLGVEAGDISLYSDTAEVQTSDGPITARWVIDTRPPARSQLLDATLTQLFSGVEVQTQEDVFDPKTVTLMGNLRPTSGGLAFDYVLPLSPRHGLIEHTLLAPSPHDPAFLDEPCDALVRKLCGTGARILRRERGWLPMGLPPSRPTPGPVILAGTPGGAVRPSSGYAFRRIQGWAARCADSLVSTGYPVTGALDPPARSLMDRIFLQALTDDMDRAADDFSRIAMALDGTGFARFMSDQPTSGDWARVIAGLPKSRYLKATMKVLSSSPPGPTAPTQRSQTWG